MIDLTNELRVAEFTTNEFLAFGVRAYNWIQRTYPALHNLYFSVLEVAAPFLIAAAVGWLLARAWRAPVSARTGAIVWASTVAGGLALRSLVFDRGVAPSFMVVAALTLGVLLCGWRAAVRFTPARRLVPPAQR